MLRRGLAAIVAIALLAGGAGAASATMVAAPGPVHGACSFGAVSVDAAAGSFTAVGTGTCVANGLSTAGTLRVTGRIDLETTCTRVVTGSATLELTAFGQLSSAARVVVAGTTGTVILAGSNSGAGGFSVVQGLCSAHTVWTGALAF